MKVDVLTLDGKKSEKIDLPNVFETKLNSNLIHKAYINLESHGFQKHATHPTAGQDVVADSNDPPTGRGIARIARMKGGGGCLLYTSPSPRDGLLSRMPSSA